MGFYHSNVTVLLVRVDSVCEHHRHACLGYNVKCCVGLKIQPLITTRNSITVRLNISGFFFIFILNGPTLY